MEKKKRKNKKIKKILKKLFLDFIPVFAGVVIALLLSNLKSRIDDNKFIKDILEKIELTANANINTLDNMLTRNKRITDSLLFYMNNKTLSISDVFSKTNGIKILPLDFSAWNVLKTSPMVTRVNYEIISLQYAAEETYKISNELILGRFNMLQMDSKNAVDKEMLYAVLNDFNIACESQIRVFENIKNLTSE